MSGIPAPQGGPDMLSSFCRRDSSKVEFMRKALPTVCLLTVCLLAWLLPLGAPASAQLDPGPDGLGVYFDLEATQVAAEAQAAQTVPAYLVATGLSLSGDVTYWSARLCPQGAAEIHGTCRNSYNYSMNMPGDSCWSATAFAFEPTLPAQGITVLADLQITAWWDEEPVLIFIQTGPEYQTTMADQLFPLNPSSGDWDLPVAVINGPAPVSGRSATWGGLKALFR